MTFHKTGTAKEIAFEIAGLRDLENAGAAVATVVASTETSLETETIHSAPPSPGDAEALGHMLGAMHAPVERCWGQAPDGFDLDRFGSGAMGREDLPLARPGTERGWGEFYAADRILPYLDSARANGSIDENGAAIISRLCDRLAGGLWDNGQPAIIHGDLWSGNVMWSPRPVLIDPACHTGHRESDLAQLAFFGAPHLPTIIAAYNEVFPLDDGWEDRVRLHQLHIGIVHASIFGGSYGGSCVSLARPYL